MVRWWLVLGILLLSGCASPAAPGPAPGTTPTVEAPANDPWNGQDRVLVAHQQWNVDTFALDALCIFGGEWYVPRTGEPVLEGTASFVVTVQTGSLETGLQIGLQFQDEDILWLEPVTDGTRTFEVRVLQEQWERDDEEAWTFWYRATAAGNPELCYTGASLGARTISIEAVHD
jgi:hypothetical protein